MAKHFVEFFYDIKCPYAWYGFETICRYQKKWNLDLRLRPFFLDGVREESGNRASGISPVKARYQMLDIKRMAKHFNVPVVIPEDLGDFTKRSTLGAMRTLTVVAQKRPDLLEEASRQMWMVFWNRHEDFTDSVLLTALEEAGFFQPDAQDVVAKSKENGTKQELRETTQIAMDHGSFGAPTILAHVGDKIEMVFGSDRMFLLADILGEKYEGPLVHKAKI